MSRSVYFSPQCDEAAALLGGYERIDASLDTIYEALERNPYGFTLIENDFTRARYARTKPIDDLPELVWIFDVDEHGNVTLRWVEMVESY